MPRVFVKVREVGCLCACVCCGGWPKGYSLCEKLAPGQIYLMMLALEAAPVSESAFQRATSYL